MAISAPSETSVPARRTLEVSVSDDPRVKKLQAALMELLSGSMTAVPTRVEDPGNFESILAYVKEGGRVPGIDYNALEAPEREAAFATAREILNRPIYSQIAGVEMKEDGGTPYHHPNPNLPEEKFGDVYPLSAAAVEKVMDTVQASKDKQIPGWDGPENQAARIAVMDRVTARMMKNNPVFGALLALSGGKSGLEAFRDSQEFYDFANNYRNFPHALAMQQIMLRSNGDTQLGIRPLDKAVGIWQPFNFPCIGFGDTLSALIAGNTVVVHTSARAVGVYKWFHDLCLEEGVPVERLHFVVPDGNPDDEMQVDPTMSRALAEHQSIGNIYFTGSLGVANQLAATQQKKGAAQKRLDIKLHAEAGGYNTMVYVGLPAGAAGELEQDFPDADSEWDSFLAALQSGSFLASLREALEDSACGLQGHKCSALSEVILARKSEDESGLTDEQIAKIKAFIIAVMNRVKIGDVTKDASVRMGALIDGAMKKKVGEQMGEILAREGARILSGDGTLKGHMDVEGQPNAMRPIVYEDPNRAPGMDVEIFAPVFRIHVVDGREGAQSRLQEIPYALTGAVYAPTLEEARDFRREMPSGVAYPNDGAYAPTTTAAPAPQVPFGGIKGSGTATGLLRPGTALHPMLFADVFSEVNEARANWNQGRGPNQLADALVAMAAILGIQVDTRKQVEGTIKA